MDLVTILVLAMSVLTAMLLFGMIAYGAKNRAQLRTLQKDLDASATTLRGSTRTLLQALAESQQQQERILQRLENLEAIVTSETWDALQAGASPEHLGLLLQDEEPKEPSAEEKAKHLARRVR